MNPHASHSRRQSGITLLEVMILMILITVVAAVVILPYLARSRVKPNRMSCLNNLKQVGLSTRQWAMDHEDRYPANTPVANGGTMGHPKFDEPWLHFATMSNELATPLVLICPKDTTRSAATSFSGAFDNRNVSYFVGLASDETRPNAILSGDRNLTTNGVQLPSGLYTLNTNDVLGWTKDMHRYQGNIGLSDGSVQQFTPAGLYQGLQTNPQTNQLAIP